LRIQTKPALQGTQKQKVRPKVGQIPNQNIKFKNNDNCPGKQSPGRCRVPKKTGSNSENPSHEQQGSSNPTRGGRETPYYQREGSQSDVQYIVPLLESYLFGPGGPASPGTLGRGGRYSLLPTRGVNRCLRPGEKARAEKQSPTTAITHNGVGGDLKGINSSENGKNILGRKLKVGKISMTDQLVTLRKKKAERDLGTLKAPQKDQLSIPPRAYTIPTPHSCPLPFS